MGSNHEKRAELFEHLAELRTRLVRSVIYLIAGTAVAWTIYDQYLFPLLTRPMMPVLSRMDSKFLLTGFPEAFMIRMQVCMVAGLVVMLPLVTLELWAFVSPGLTANEKRPLMWVVPLSVFLFVSGVTLCYFILPAAFAWFVLYVPKTATFMPTMQQSLLFTVKMLFVFGVAFELPVVLMLLAKVGVVDSGMLRANWRACVVAVSVVAAIATPSNDAFTMLCMAVPLAFLFLFSIFLVWLVEEERERPWLVVARSFGGLFRFRSRK